MQRAQRGSHRWDVAKASLGLRVLLLVQVGVSEYGGALFGGSPLRDFHKHPNLYLEVHGAY